MRLVIALPLLALLLLAALYGARRYGRYRDQRDLWIRHEKSHGFCIVPLSHTKED